MIQVPCPYCGLRNASEFRWVGEMNHRPDPNRTTPEEWRDYLYMNHNPAGWTTETCYHRAGCRQYFVVERHTMTNELRAARRPAAQLRREADGDRPEVRNEEAAGGKS